MRRDQRTLQADARRLDVAIEENLAWLGFGAEHGSRAQVCGIHTID